MNKGMSKEDRLVSDIMKNFQSESPSTGFTVKVMESIQLEKSYSSISSQPLISKSGWIGITAGLGILIALIFLGYGSEVPGEAGYFGQILSSLRFPEINFSFTRLHRIRIRIFFLI